MKSERKMRMLETLWLFGFVGAGIALVVTVWKAVYSGMRGLAQFILMGTVGVACLVFAILLFPWWIDIPLLLLLLSAFLMLKGTFVQIAENQRGLVERFGAYERTLGAGWYFLVPGIEKLVAVVYTHQYAIDLFAGEGEKKRIDLRDGSVGIGKATVWIRLCSPDRPYLMPAEEEAARAKKEEPRPKDGTYRAIYGVEDWKRSATEIVGGALRAHLGGQESISELETISGHNLAIETDEEGKMTLPNTLLHEIKDELMHMGLEFGEAGIVIQDFDMPQESIQMRQAVDRAKQKAIAAGHEGEALAIESVSVEVQMRAHATNKTAEEVMEELRNNPAALREVTQAVQERVSRRMSLDAGALHDYRVEGLEMLGLLASAFTGARGQQSPPRQRRPNRRSGQQRRGGPGQPPRESEGR